MKTILLPNKRRFKKIITPTQIIFSVIAAVTAIMAVASFARRSDEKIWGWNKNVLGVVALLVTGFLLMGTFGILGQTLGSYMGAKTLAVVDNEPAGLCTLDSECQTGYMCGTDGKCVAKPTVTAGSCPFQPTVTYSTIDKFGTTTITGTSYYKAGTAKASTSALINLNKGTDYEYWLSNATYYVEPKTITADCTNMPFQADAWANGTLSISAYDTKAHITPAVNGDNVTLGAGQTAKVDLTLSGESKKSSGPFGGIMVVEYDKSMASVLASADMASYTDANGNVISKPVLLDQTEKSPYTLTYSPSATTKVSQQWVYTSALDDGKAQNRIVHLTYTSSDTVLGDNSTTISFYPANYYVTNGGNILLDTQKVANSDQTRTNLGNVPTITFYFH